jgi:hypothetical protein
MRKLIAIIIILFCIAIPARADYGPRPPAWETAVATKIARQERKRTPTPTVTPAPYPYPMPVEQDSVIYTLWYRIMDWVAE